MIKGVKFNSINENISKHSYKDFGLVLTEQNIGVPITKIYTYGLSGYLLNVEAYNSSLSLSTVANKR